MAVAGLRNIAAFDNSFLTEPQSPILRQFGEQDRPSNHAPTLLRRWRELDGEHVVNHPNLRPGENSGQERNDGKNSDYVCNFTMDGPRSVNEDDSIADANETGSQMGSEDDHDDSYSFSSEQSIDFGEVERRRVRQIFREWMSSGVRSHSSDISHNKNYSSAQWLGENERERVRIIREWVQMNSQQRNNCNKLRDEGVAEIGSNVARVLDGSLVNHSEIGQRRAFRKLCGRQALLDLVMRTQRERNRELQELLERRAVSGFPHRNRIQSLLRGRFLIRNERVVQVEKSASMAAGELGFLRERHAVSDLREEFLSRLDKVDHGRLKNTQSDASPSCDLNVMKNEQTQQNSKQEVIDDFCNQSELTNGEGEINSLHETHEQVLQNEEDEDALLIVEPVVYSEGSGQDRDLEFQELFHDGYAPSIEASDAPEADAADGEILEGNLTEDFDWQDTESQSEDSHESVAEHEESNWQQLSSVGYSTWTDGPGEDIGEHWQENSTNEWYQEVTDGVEESAQIQESQEGWHGNDFQEAIDSWLDMPSGRETNIRIVDTFYLPDDDNVYSMELRELLSRRRVSSLLHSGFRESLDQLIQSYIERQGHASVDWEMDGASSPAIIEQEQGQQRGDHDGIQADGVERDAYGISSPPLLPSQSQPLWDQNLQDENWSDHNLHQRPGMEWEIINEMRIDMTKLQQRMNNMQRMLEACMEMQVELQRSVRQEVSAALNRYVVTTDACLDNLEDDKSKWDYVRKGICCMCCNSNIDSLLYRCGHMCACSQCAEKLVHDEGKCPMCRAPILEVIRAYSIQ